MWGDGIFGLAVFGRFELSLILAPAIRFTPVAGAVGVDINGRVIDSADVPCAWNPHWTSAQCARDPPTSDRKDHPGSVPKPLAGLRVGQWIPDVDVRTA